MAPKSVLAFLVLAVMAISVAEAQSVSSVSGTLYCSVDGGVEANPSATPIFPNANLNVECEPGLLAASTNGTTDASGQYSVTFTPQSNATRDQIAEGCRLVCYTPLSTCSNGWLPPSGHLVSPLQPVQTNPGARTSSSTSNFNATGFQLTL